MGRRVGTGTETGIGSIVRLGRRVGLVWVLGFGFGGAGCMDG